MTEQIAMLQERLYPVRGARGDARGPRRWSRVRSLGEARSLLTILFNFAASAHDARRTAGRLGSQSPPPLRGARALCRTPPAGPVVAQADAVLNALKNKTAARAKEVRTTGVGVRGTIHSRP